MTPEDVKRLRALMSMTQAELAAALGVWQVTVARWESGMRGVPEPTARLIERLAKEGFPKKVSKTNKVRRRVR